MAERTVFQKIFDRDIPAVEIYRNDRHGVLVFLDQYPVAAGHMLVIPKEPVDQLTQLSFVRALQLQAVATRLMYHAADVLRPAPLRVGLAISGYGIPHTHIHVLPSYERGDGVRLYDYERTRPNNQASRDELLRVSKLLTCQPALTHELDALLDQLAP